MHFTTASFSVAAQHEHNLVIQLIAAVSVVLLIAVGVGTGFLVRRLRDKRQLEAYRRAKDL